MGCSEQGNFRQRDIGAKLKLYRTYSGNDKENSIMVHAFTGVTYAFTVNLYSERVPKHIMGKQLSLQQMVLGKKTGYLHVKD